MMGYGLMGGYGGWGIVGTITWLLVLVDLFLLGAWLLKQINKK